MATDESPRAADRQQVFAAERIKAFVDAVVAISMTLLVLPLTEGVSDAAANDENTAQWFGDHWQQLLSFALSFALVAMFWIAHHRLYAAVERVSIGLLWLTMLWLASIVWLPVATALSGEMADSDSLVKIVYIGSMIFVCLTSLLIRLFLWRHSELHAIERVRLQQGTSVDLSMALLFAVALVVSLAVPRLSYFPLFLMFLVGPMQRLITRMLGAGRRPGVGADD